jgi:hypothetical protein
MKTPPLQLWVIYENPADFPGRVVARRWLLDSPTKEYFVGDTVEEVAAMLPRGLFKLPRSPIDDPCIVETWI